MFSIKENAGVIVTVLFLVILIGFAGYRLVVGY